LGLLDTSHYGAIRALVRTDLDEVELPDETIALPPFAPAADLSVQSEDPAWDTRDGEALVHLQTAASYRAAALLLRSLPQVTRRGVADKVTLWQPYDAEKRAQLLESRATGEIAEVLAEARRFPVFFTAVGNNPRGR